MSSPVTVLETITLTAPFGVRFWDVATVAPAEGGLSVVGYPDAFPELRIFGQENHSGVFCFSGLPGLRSMENGAGKHDSIYVAMNTHWEGHWFELPKAPHNQRWHISVNTRVKPPEDCWKIGSEPALSDQGGLLVGDRSVVILVGK